MNNATINGKREMWKQRQRMHTRTREDKDRRVALQRSDAMQYEQYDYRFDAVVAETEYDARDFIRVYTFERNGINLEAYGMMSDGSIYLIIPNTEYGNPQYFLNAAMAEVEDGLR